MANADEKRPIYAMTARQITAGRVLLDWSQVELAHRAGVASRTVQKAEAGETIRAGTMARIVTAFEDAGLVILSGRAVGVALIQP